MPPLNLIPELRSALKQGELTIETSRPSGEFPQEKIAAPGEPYQPTNRNGAGTTLPTKTVRVSSPAVAAESTQARFTRDELTELVRLLTATRTSDPDNKNLQPVPTASGSGSPPDQQHE